MVAQYINYSILCGLFCSWQGVPPQSFECGIWDCVGFYRIHTFLNPLVKCQVKSFLKLIISFLVLHIVLLSLQKLLSLVASIKHVPLTLHVYLRLPVGLVQTYPLGLSFMDLTKVLISFIELLMIIQSSMYVMIIIPF
jgi:hypothetical protein